MFQKVKKTQKNNQDLQNWFVAQFRLQQDNKKTYKQTYKKKNGARLRLKT